MCSRTDPSMLPTSVFRLSEEVFKGAIEEGPLEY